MFRLIFCAVVLASTAFPQAILEHALAASGGSAAGIAGKPVSDGATVVFSKIGSLLEKASADKTAPKKDPPQPAVYATYATMPPAPPLPEVVPEAFQQIRPGIKREELLATVGTPSSRITIPENDQMIELYRYRAKGGTLGTVRLVGGQVTEVIQ